MSILTHSPAIVRDGLVLCLDAGAVRSYDPSTNSGTELVTNGTMEADSNWANYNSPTTNERSSTQAKAGTYSRKFVADSTYDGIKSDTFTTVANKVYIVSAWVYADDQSGVHIQLLDGDESSGTGHNQNTNHAVTRDEWTHLEIPISVSTGGSSSRVTFQSASGDATGTWYIDQVSVREKSVWYDLSGNFNDGAMSSVIQTAESGAGGTKSFDFDGTSDYISFAAKDYGISATWTVAWWMKMDSDGLQCFFSMKESGSNNKIEFITNNTIREIFANLLDHDGTVIQVDTDNTVWSTGEWTHVAITNNGGTATSSAISFYINGEAKSNNVVNGSTITPMEAGSRTLNIGREESGSRYVDGKIATCMMWSAPLTAKEIKDIYIAQKGRFGK